MSMIETEENVNEKKKISKQIHFSLCESCFWCASSYLVEDRTVSKCPMCNTGMVKSMLVLDEVFKNLISSEVNNI